MVAYSKNNHCVLISHSWRVDLAEVGGPSLGFFMGFEPTWDEVTSKDPLTHMSGVVSGCWLEFHLGHMSSRAYVCGLTRWLGFPHSMVAASKSECPQTREMETDN